MPPRAHCAVPFIGWSHCAWQITDQQIENEAWLARACASRYMCTSTLVSCGNNSTRSILGLRQCRDAVSPSELMDQRNIISSTNTDYDISPAENLLHHVDVWKKFSTKKTIQKESQTPEERPHQEAIQEVERSRLMCRRFNGWQQCASNTIAWEFNVRSRYSRSILPALHESTANRSPTAS
jgi:hypothetical protein